jgi:hypothetical protein
MLHNMILHIDYKRGTMEYCVQLISKTGKCLERMVHAVKVAPWCRLLMQMKGRVRVTNQ